MCINHPLTIDGIRSVFLYQGTVRQAILQLKYKHLKVVATPLARLLAEFLRSYPLKGEVLVPVPLHPRRLRERGYNQASLLARELGQSISLPVVEDTLVRVRDAVPQARTGSALERRRNVQDAFACHKGLEGRQILLVDDVCTTGATLAACALKSRGITVKDAPAWDLTAETVAGDGFDILHGGEIKALWIDVASQPFNVKQQAVVQLRVSAAGLADKAVFKTLNINSKMDRQDIAFSFDTVEGLLSEALSSAIDQFLRDDDFKKKIH